jgi:hypothetical protein
MKKLFLLLFFATSINYSQSNLNGSLTADWEGNWWSYNINMGSWFPSYENSANFSKDGYSWGQIRSINQISPGTSINIAAQIINSSGGVHDDAAYFAIGDGWAFYGLHNYGIVFRNGIVNFFEDNGIQVTQFKDTIGTYVSGEMINFTLTFNNDGTLSAQGNHFSGTYTPANVVQNAKWIIASANSEQYQGFYIKSIDGVQITTIEDEIVELSIKDYSLYQNYPNPFNPGTKISWRSAKGSNQSIKVFDILGNEVATLVDEYRGAGDYQINFDSHGLPSGIYFYQLQIGNFVQSKKMILLK